MNPKTDITYMANMPEISIEILVNNKDPKSNILFAYPNDTAFDEVLITNNSQLGTIEISVGEQEIILEQGKRLRLNRATARMVWYVLVNHDNWTHLK
jgi:hypothetical protein